MMQLELVTAEALKYKGAAQQVLLPGVMGEMGILTSHSPLVTMLDPGIVRVDTPSGEQIRYVVSQGFATVANDEVVCLVDAALEPKEVKVEEVKTRLAALETELAASPNALERTRMEIRFLKAQLQLVGSV